MTTTINASPTNGIVQTADGSGVMKLQSNGVTTNALAWARFSSSGGSITTNASYNISSITLTATGVYTIVFTNAMSDANYVGLASTSTDNSSSVQVTSMFNNASSNVNVAPTTTGFVFSTRNTSGTGFNEAYVGFSIFGN